MATNRKALENFLLRRCADSGLAVRTMAGLQPYFDIAGSRRCRLEPGSKPLAGRTAAVLTQLTGRTVPAAYLVSRARPFKRRPGMSEADLAAAGANLWPFAAGLVDVRLSDILEKLEPGIAAGLGQELWDELWSVLDGSLWFDLWDAIRWSLEVGTDHAAATGLWTACHGSLACFIGASLQPGPVSPARLRPLIELLPAALPLGALKDGSGAWIALCA